jgi:hypothetical protein
VLQTGGECRNDGAAGLMTVSAIRAKMLRCRMS